MIKESTQIIRAIENSGMTDAWQAKLIALVKKDIERAPQIHEATFVCSACEMAYHDKSNYCPHCGQKQDWRNSETVQINEISVFDEEETHENCTVQILRNSITGEVSVGWYENDKETGN